MNERAHEETAIGSLHSLSFLFVSSECFQSSLERKKNIAEFFNDLKRTRGSREVECWWLLKVPNVKASTASITYDIKSVEYNQYLIDLTFYLEILQVEKWNDRLLSMRQF